MRVKNQFEAQGVIVHLSGEGIIWRIQQVMVDSCNIVDEVQIVEVQFFEVKMKRIAAIFLDLEFEGKGIHTIDADGVSSKN